MLDAGENSSSSSAAVSAECFLSSLNMATTKSGRKKSGNRRRFNDDQIRLLEAMFENETKLEPKKKLELARELGLQPRQVAIWFQNKRARCKSKQLERDYDLLNSNYHSLASQFESLKKENHSLLLQLKNLNELIDKSEKEGQDRECSWRRDAAAAAGNSVGFPPGVSKISSGGGCNIESSTEMDVKPSLSPERSEYGAVLDDGDGDADDDESSRNPDYNLGILDQEPAAAELMNMVEAADSCLTSPGGWGSCFDSVVCSYQQWWDFYEN